MINRKRTPGAQSFQALEHFEPRNTPSTRKVPSIGTDGVGAQILFSKHWKNRHPVFQGLELFLPMFGNGAVMNFESEV